MTTTSSSCEEIPELSSDPVQPSGEEKVHEMSVTESTKWSIALCSYRIDISPVDRR